MSERRRRVTTVLGGSATLGAAIWALWPAQVPVAAPAPLQQLHARCVLDMLRQTCRVMSPAEAASPQDREPVFVAGLGPVDATVYAELRASGSAMCDTVRERCAADWAGPACRTARALYGGAASDR